MKIKEIYTKYNLMPSLQLHMFRVAAVGEIICEKKGIHPKDVVTVGLLHDMGNIIKFKLDLFPEFLEPQGLEYWQNIQNEFFQKYGKDEHEATLQIVTEVGCSDRVYDILLAVGFSNAEKNADTDDMEKKIAMYSDMRVEPHGVVSLDDRLKDGRKRFKITRPAYDDSDFFTKMSTALKKIEEQIFADISFRPEQINDEEVNKRIEKLKQAEI